MNYAITAQKVKVAELLKRGAKESIIGRNDRKIIDNRKSRSDSFSLAR
jgi:hypothetical protein